MNFAENLVTLRKQRGWSQEELGSQIGVTRQTVSKWEMGQSTPELEKLVELARLFDLSLDRLVGLEEGLAVNPPQNFTGVRSCGAFYEYISPVKVFNLPLIHIRYGLGFQPARGIIAIGNYAMGVVAVGGCSLGVLSFGGVSAGLLLSLGGVSAGLAALGGLAIGGFAVGGCAVGQWLAMGGSAFSSYLAIGGGAWSKELAIGGSAYGRIAVGVDKAEGIFTFLRGSGIDTQMFWVELKQEFPYLWDWVRNVIQWVLN